MAQDRGVRPIVLYQAKSLVDSTDNRPSEDFAFEPSRLPGKELNAADLGGQVMALLDTDLTSEPRSGNPQTAATVPNWAEEQPVQQLCFSAILAPGLGLLVVRMKRRESGSLSWSCPARSR